jgi:hypothetical protein
MPNTSTRKGNAGGFRKGADPRRHVHSATCGHRLYQFTEDDRSKGFSARRRRADSLARPLNSRRPEHVGAREG